MGLHRYSCSNITKTPAYLFDTPPARPVKASAPLPPDPNPHKYKCIKQSICGDLVAVMLRYEGCTPYGGIKILVYKGTDVLNKIAENQPIDPHFLDTADSPIARFPGSIQGWKDALFYIDSASLTYVNM